jgi:hypothetical protein
MVAASAQVAVPIFRQGPLRILKAGNGKGETGNGTTGNGKRHRGKRDQLRFFESSAELGIADAILLRTTIGLGTVAWRY